MIMPTVCLFFCFIIGLKLQAYIAFTRASAGAFWLYLPQTWTDLDETQNISERSWCALTQKIRGQSPQGLPYGCRNVFWFFVTNTTQTFIHLSCTDFGCFWNKRRESMCACVHWWKISKFLHREFYWSQKQLKMGTFEGVFVLRLQPELSHINLAVFIHFTTNR